VETDNPFVPDWPGPMRSPALLDDVDIHAAVEAALKQPFVPGEYRAEMEAEETACQELECRLNEAVQENERARAEQVSRRVDPGRDG
jgi:hypothetical protein